MNPLNSMPRTIIVGVVVSVVIAALIGGYNFQILPLGRWLHFLAGIAWIGLLYYFNFVQVPALNRAAADAGGPGGAGITRYVAPLALVWFRWAAVVTWLSGALYLWLRTPGGDDFIGAFALGMTGETLNVYQLVIGLGAWMGTIMLFNVWVLIWPNQKKLLGMVPASDEEKARAKRTAFLASRTNTVLSIPMLMCMGGASHGLPF
ncbi:MAG TPA: urate hydroxylase PuuD [Gammaproteobacteria bacterium]|nr:urate hydroxylase PuuD [Gammaproteobacteria bacterium]